MCDCFVRDLPPLVPEEAQDRSSNHFCVLGNLPVPVGVIEIGHFV